MPLMTYEEYEKIEHPTPFVLRIDGVKQHLVYFGEAHSFDPKDSQWDKMKVLWAEFVALPSKKVALVEGGVRKVWATEKEAIEKDGGMGLLTYLADQAGIQALSPEPDSDLEKEILRREFSQDEIDYYYFARMALQWNRLPKPRPDFEKYTNFPLKKMEEIHRNMFDKPLDIYDEDAFYDASNPVVIKSKSNEVSRRSGEIRDEHIANEIKRLWDEGHSIFAQFGWSHVVMQEPLLRDFLK